MITRDDIEELGRQWRLRVRNRIELVGRTVHGGLLIGAALLVYLVGDNAQGQELFRQLLEGDPMPYAQQAFAAAAAFVLSAVLFFNYRLFLPYLGRDGENNSSTARFVAQVGLAGITLAPWLAYTMSLYLMWGNLERSRVLLSTLPGMDDVAELRDQRNSVLALIDVIQYRSLFAFGVLIVCAALSYAILIRLDSGRRTWLISTVRVLLSLATIAILLWLGVAAAATDTLNIDPYRAMGTLAATLVTATGLFALALVFGWVCREMGMSNYFVFAIVLLMTPLAAQVSAVIASVRQKFTQTATVDPPSAKAPLPFDCAVRAWALNRGGVPNAAACPASLDALAGSASRAAQPMLIVSAQGGGMYAAMASSLFLGRLQDYEKRFAHSIFAISGVSGGAIGSAMFDALARSEGCKPGASNSGKRRIEAQIPALLLQPHLATIVGNVLPDTVKKIPSLFFWPRDRADAFTESLLADCPALGERFEDAWNPTNGRPALVLNTTWMSNGHRVAFAPFALKKIGDRTLWSFGDVYETLAPLQNGRAFVPSVADAAVASARFPGILPPLSLQVRVTKQQTIDTHWHSYGDGGYADSSGVTTALEMLVAAREAVGASKAVVPKLIILTYDTKEVTPTDSPGTAFTDTWSPVAALLGVRQNLAGSAIARADAVKVNSPEAKTVRLSLDPERYGLVLGFQLSRTSYEILSLLIGRPEWCGDRAPVVDNPVLKNSCAAREIADSVKGSAVGG